MKNIFFWILLIALVFGVYLDFFYPEEEYAPLDLNRDGVVNIVDWSIFDAQFPKE